MENKIKLNTGLASIILLACLFAGWQTLLLVTVIMFLFCEVEERTKQVAISVITFYIGYTIVSTGWDIIVSGINIVLNTIDSFINSILIGVLEIDLDLEIVNKLDILIDFVFGIIKSIVSILFAIVKLAFIVGTLTGKNGSSNPLSAKINEFVNKALNYINGNFAATQRAPQQAPIQPMQPTQQQAPVQPMQQVAPSNNVPPQNPNQNM